MGETQVADVAPFTSNALNDYNLKKIDLFTAAMLGRNIWVNAGVSNDTNQGSNASWSERVHMLFLCPSAHWRGSATPNGCDLVLNAPAPTGNFLFIVCLRKRGHCGF